jgi:hypothetical protein
MTGFWIYWQQVFPEFHPQFLGEYNSYIILSPTKFWKSPTFSKNLLLMRISVFWDVAPCCMIVYRRFRRACYLQHRKGRGSKHADAHLQEKSSHSPPRDPKISPTSYYEPVAGVARPSTPLYLSRHRTARFKATEWLRPPCRAAPNPQHNAASFATLLLPSCLHLLWLRCSCCIGVRFFCDLEAHSLVTAAIDSFLCLLVAFPAFELIFVAFCMTSRIIFVSDNLLFCLHCLPTALTQILH